ncbi:MAG: ComF family protein [Candidatus Omnitrophica bacterium]|nr:ComF family protein [Candidatus Omnitrophota bacterium]
MLPGLLKGLKDLIYPNYCLVCKNRVEATKERDLVCRGCWDKVEKNLPPFCASCGRHLDAKAIEKNTCASCANVKFYFDRAFSPCPYTGSVKKLIHEFKYGGKDYLGKPLGSIMNTFIRDYNLPIQHLDFIIPVPLHKSRQREREFNQAEILSRQVAEEFNKELLTEALIRSKPTKTQTELTLEERRRNVEESFRVARPELIKDTNLLLIDDVLTTGATSNEAAKSLKQAGAKIVLLMTLAD